MGLIRLIENILITILILVIVFSLIFGGVLAKNINYIQNNVILQKYLGMTNTDNPQKVKKQEILDVTERAISDKEGAGRRIFIPRDGNILLGAILVIIVLLSTGGNEIINIGNLKTMLIYLVIILASIYTGFCAGVYYLKIL